MDALYLDDQSAGLHLTYVEGLLLFNWYFIFFGYACTLPM